MGHEREVELGQQMSACLSLLPSQTRRVIPSPSSTDRQYQSNSLMSSTDSTSQTPSVFHRQKVPIKLPYVEEWPDRGPVWAEQALLKFISSWNLSM